MTDIVDRLRERYYRRASESNDEARIRRQRERDDAADEIERLRERLADCTKRYTDLLDQLGAGADM